MTKITKQDFNSTAKDFNLIPIGANSYLISGCDLVLTYFMYDPHSDPLLEAIGRVPLDLGEIIYRDTKTDGHQITSINNLSKIDSPFESFTHPDICKKGRKYCLDNEPEKCYINGYQINSLESLKWFIETVRIHYMNNPIKVQDTIPIK